MEISTNTNTLPTNVQSSTSQTESEQAVLSSDFETFLKMLTTQMEYQDPLNPMDSTDFATQLATFSSVEQQVMTNDLLTDLNTQIGALSMAQLTGWIGMEARADMPIAFEGEPVTLTLQTSDLADSAQLVIHDANGTLVQRLDIPPRGGEFAWAGLDSDGTPLPNGQYSATVESYSQGDVIETHPAQVHATITEARQNGAQTELVMAGGQTVLATDVAALREPSG